MREPAAIVNEIHDLDGRCRVGQVLISISLIDVERIFTGETIGSDPPVREPGQILGTVSTDPGGSGGRRRIRG